MTMAGRLGYSEREFWSMSPRYFYNAAAGYVLAQRDQMELARYGWFYSVLPYLKDGYSEVEQVVSFSWEAEKLEAKRREKVEFLKNAWDTWMKDLEAKKQAKDGIGTT